ncbi:ADPribosylation factor subfamily protein [Pelomyxa schiedti]|nr:ADPribosylation factor subfamily protein [Pelomyxa schiedti]
MAAVIDGQVFTWGGLYAAGAPEWLVFGSAKTTSVSCGALSTWAMSSNDKCACRWDLDSPTFSNPSRIARVALLQPAQFYIDQIPVQIAAGALHTLVVSNTGALRAIGQNEMGQLGVGDSKERFEFVPCNFEPGIHISFVAAGGKHSLAVADNGQLYSWGSGIQGQLGHGDECSHSSPKVVSYFNGMRATRVACGDKHSLVATDTGSLFAFGENKRGQLGTGDNTNSNLPKPVLSLKSERISQIAAGGAYGSAHSLALSETRILFAWGSNDQGQLGVGDQVDRNTPTAVSLLANRNILSIACGWLSSACVVEEDIPCTNPVLRGGISSLISLGNFSTCPIDVLLMIIGLLDYEALCSVSQTCRAMFFVASDNRIWQDLYLKEKWDPRIQKSIGSIQICKSGNWKQHFFTALRETKRLQKNAFGSNKAMELVKKVKTVSQPENTGFFGSFLAKIGWGSSTSKMISSFPEMQILMHGLDAAGKTTILYKLKIAPETTIPTIGFSIETSQYSKNIKIISWDCGGGITPWRRYYPNTTACIWVIDSNDRERMDEVRDELTRMAHQDELEGIPFLIFANKRDLPGALSVYEVAQRVDLNHIMGKIHPLWYIQGCSGTSGEGILEGFEWLSLAITASKFS